MGKKISVFVLGFLLIFCIGSCVYASDPASGGTCGDNAVWSLSGGTLTISGTGTVTAGDWPLEEILKIVIDDGITAVSERAFYDAHNAVEIIVPASVTSIGEKAFGQCNSLTAITLPGNVNTSIFEQCGKLSEITIAPGSKSIGSGAFSGLTTLKKVSIPDSVTVIGARAFSGCSRLSSIPVPAYLASIGSGAFNGCSNLKNLALPASVTSIGSGAFSSCTRLTLSFADAIPSDLVWDTLASCKGSIYGVELPASVTTIWEKAFENSNIRTIKIPTSVESIRTRAFQSCQHLNTVEISGGVKSIGDYAFMGCGMLQEAPLPDSVTSIGPGAFWGCQSLKEVTIPRGVTAIGDHTFYNCENLSSIVIPNSVTTIEDSAFYQCTALSSINIPASVTSIGGMAFSHCKSLTDIPFPANVRIVGAYSLTNCSSLQKIVIPDSVTELAVSAFAGCTSLTSVDFPGRFTSIPRSGFQACSNLSSINIPDSVTTIGASAFSGCTSLKSIDIPNSVTSIETFAFNESGLESLTIPDSVTELTDNFIHHCLSLKTITIPASLKSMTQQAFNGASHVIKDVYYGGSIYEWIDKGFLSSFVSDHKLHCSIPSEITKGKAVVEGTFTYDSLKKTPALTITDDNGYKLLEGMDYKVTYSDNVNAGTAKASFTYTGNYSGSGETTFTIQPEKASKLTVTVSPASSVYTGSAITPTVTAKDRFSNILKMDKDYTVSYTDNVNAGTASVKITFTRNFTGTRTAEFTIERAVQPCTPKAANTRIAVGESASILCDGVKESPKITYSSADKTIADVDSEGKVTAIKVGTVKITVSISETANYQQADKSVKIKVVPAATAALTAVNKASGVRLTWKKVAGAAGYYIYRNGKKIQKIEDRKIVAFTDTTAANGRQYTYKVRAFAGTGASTLSTSVDALMLKRPVISSLKNTSSRAMTVKWERNRKATGYLIQYSSSKSFSGGKKVKVKKNSKVSEEISRLKKGKKYFVRIRSYKTVDENTYYSAWSAVKKVIVKK